MTLWLDNTQPKQHHIHNLLETKLITINNTKWIGQVPGTDNSPGRGQAPDPTVHSNTTHYIATLYDKNINAWSIRLRYLADKLIITYNDTPEDSPYIPYANHNFFDTAAKIINQYIKDWDENFRE